MDRVAGEGWDARLRLVMKIVEDRLEASAPSGRVMQEVPVSRTAEVPS
jgi:hypothetical protein